MLTIADTKKKNGFTLIELIIVMAIMAVLTVISLANFRTTQAKARDAQRKSDLGQIKKALEMYYNDYGQYPVADGGKIKIGTNTFDWKTNASAGDELKDDKDTVYLKELPGDPGSIPYCYLSAGSSFQIYAKLENNNDLQKLGGTRPCGGLENTYNYGVASANSVP